MPRVYLEDGVASSEITIGDDCLDGFYMKWVRAVPAKGGRFLPAHGYRHATRTGEVTDDGLPIYVLGEVDWGESDS